jgi:hypothetical protein
MISAIATAAIATSTRSTSTAIRTKRSTLAGARIKRPDGGSDVERANFSLAGALALNKAPTFQAVGLQ